MKYLQISTNIRRFIFRTLFLVHLLNTMVVNLTNMSKFTYDISDIENIPENAILQSNFYNSKNMELNNINTYLLVTEKADYDIDFIKKTFIVTITYLYLSCFKYFVQLSH